MCKTTGVRTTFVETSDTGRIRFTRTGIERYKARFARCGYDIHTIRTKVHFEKAVDAMFEHEMSNQVAQMRGQDPELDKILDGLPGSES